MKVMKRVCQYAFLGLLLAMSVLWCVRCQMTLNEINEKINSLEFVDMAINSYPEAVELYDEAKHFTNLRNYGIIAALSFVLILVICIVVQVLIKKKKAKRSVVIPDSKAPAK